MLKQLVNLPKPQVFVWTSSQYGFPLWEGSQAGSRTLNWCAPRWAGCHLGWRSGTEMCSAPLWTHNRHSGEDRPCSQGWPPGRWRWRRSVSRWYLCLSPSSWNSITLWSYTWDLSKVSGPPHSNSGIWEIFKIVLRGQFHSHLCVTMHPL
jgi:hypothetical protein